MQKPKRRKQIPGTTPLLPLPLDDEGLQGREFDLYDEVCEEMRKLSPDVERFRKGKGPKRERERERCASFWDGDFWPVRRVGGDDGGVGVGEGEGKGGDGDGEVEERKGREVLGEVEGSERLTREVGRLGRQGWDFGFRVGVGDRDGDARRMRRADEGYF